MKKEIPLKGSWIDPTLIRYFKTFEDFYKWADPKFSGLKKDFEELYYEYHDKPKKGSSK